MNYHEITRSHEGQKVKLQPWGYEQPMDSPPIDRTIDTVGHEIFSTEEDRHSDGTPLNRSTWHWRVAVDE